MVKSHHQKGEVKPSSLNRALVFVKPHACSKKVNEFIERYLNEHNLKIVKSFERTGDQMKHFIDEHYVLLSRSALRYNPKDIEISAEKKRKFKEKFGEDWDKVLKEDRVHNAKKFAEKFKETAVGQEWDGKGTVKICVAPGTIVGLLPSQAQSKDAPVHYVINGFYLDLRAQFMTPEARVKCFDIEFNEGEISWEKFRTEIVGCTNPEDAHPNSLRRELMENYKWLGLTEKPNYGNNCIHASAGPLEALRERLIWYETPIEKDPFAIELVQSGIEIPTIVKLLDNMMLEVDGGMATSTFDLTEGINSSEAKQRILSSPSVRTIATVRTTSSMSSLNSGYVAA